MTSFALPDPPDRSTLKDNAYAAIIQDMLERITTDPDAIERGWTTFWTRLAAGDLFEEAARAAIDAAVPLRGLAADDRFKLAIKEQFGTGGPAPVHNSGTGFFTAVREVFGK